MLTTVVPLKYVIFIIFIDPRDTWKTAHLNRQSSNTEKTKFTMKSLKRKTGTIKANIKNR